MQLPEDYRSEVNTVYTQLLINLNKKLSLLNKAVKLATKQCTVQLGIIGSLQEAWHERVYIFGSSVAPISPCALLVNLIKNHNKRCDERVVNVWHYSNSKRVPPKQYKLAVHLQHQMGYINVS
jgi:hypothetical protein